MRLDLKQYLTWHLAATFAALVTLGGIFIHIYDGYQRFSECDVVVHSSTQSPDAERSAVVFGTECNATVGFNTQVSIAPAGRPFSRDKNPSFLSLAGEHDLAVSWVSDKLIEIDIPEGAKVYRNESSVDGIAVVYK